jgi:hypothetical protein
MQAVRAQPQLMSSFYRIFSFPCKTTGVIQDPLSHLEECDGHDQSLPVNPCKHMVHD